ncbi:hypothetical protein N0V90_013361 [Kalmusia sp. IMI 367209]|nr:hypothetical protein N0V90_013361 [Kalmusia sp. IMI 367209]
MRFWTQAATTTVTNTPSPISTTSSSASPSATATASASNHRNIAVIGGAAGGGFCVALLIGVIVFFWLHTRKSRRQHQRGFDRRLSDSSDRRSLVGKTQARHLEMAQGNATPNWAALVAQVPNPGLSPASPVHARQTEHQAYHTDFPIDSGVPYRYKHYSADDFGFPERNSSLPDVWKTSHRPHASSLFPAETPGAFELESPVSPQSYGSLRGPVSPLHSEPASPARHAVPILPPPAPALGKWKTARRSSG